MTETLENVVDLDRDALNRIECLLQAIAESRYDSQGIQLRMIENRNRLFDRRDRSMLQRVEYYLPDLSKDTLDERIARVPELKAFAGSLVQQHFHNAMSLRPKWFVIAALRNSGAYSAYMTYVDKHLPRLREELVAYLEHHVDSLDCMASIRYLDVDIMALSQRIEQAERDIESADRAAQTLRSLALHVHHCTDRREMKEIIDRLSAMQRGYEKSSTPSHAFDNTELLVRNWIDHLPRTLRDWGAQSH